MFKKVTMLILTILLICISISITGCQKEPLDAMKEQLENDCSFNTSLMYMNLATNGMSQKMEQKYGKDGSFYFLVDRHIWNHTTDYDETEKNEFYYQYENDILYCYMKNNDGEISKQAISKSVIDEMTRDKMKIIGADSLFPTYLENFTEEFEGEKYKFSLPVGKALNDDTFLSTYLNNVFALSGAEYDES